MKLFPLVDFQGHHFDRLPPEEDFLTRTPPNSNNNNLHTILNSNYQPDLHPTPPQDLRQEVSN